MTRSNTPLYTFRLRGELNNRVIQAADSAEALSVAISQSNSNSELETIYWNFYGLHEIKPSEVAYYLGEV